MKQVRVNLEVVMNINMSPTKQTTNVQYALSARLYLLGFIYYDLSAMLYLLCFI